MHAKQVNSDTCVKVVRQNDMVCVMSRFIKVVVLCVCSAKEAVLTE